MHGHHHHGPPTLYRRFYLHTLFVVFASVLLCFAVFWLTRPSQFAARFTKIGAGLASIVADRLAPELDRPELGRTLAELAGRFDGQLSVYDPRGQPLASAGPPLPPPTPRELAQASEGGAASRFERGTHFVLVPIRRGRALVGFLEATVSHRYEPWNGWRLAGMFALVLGLVALLMIPATRSVTKPLERLTESARRFGTGDFAHRAPVRGDDEIGKLAAAMNEMAERLSAMIHTQRELLANVSHELRSPLARIQVALELARERAASAAAGSAANSAIAGPLDEIGRDAAELAHLVDDCLAASRLELRPDSLRLTRCSPGALVTEAADRLLASGLSSERLESDIAPGLPEVWADRELCAHALQNLLDNAEKHTPPGTVISVGARLEGDRIRLFVRDRGPGLSPDELPRLFEPFYRPDASRSRAGGGGAGLGLSLVRRIAELHGGEPSVESSPGGGSTFSFTVPTA
ncbi:MAG: HAMP domain-containing sensor histidine kinase [Deltaproteobacteria bacterium]